MSSRRVAACAAAIGVSLLSVSPAAAVTGGRQIDDPAAAPWMVTIATKGPEPLALREKCGGVLIAPSRVATAGHCLDHLDPGHLELHLGGGPLSGGHGRIVSTKGYSIHPGYRLVYSPSAPGDFERAAVANDAAVLELASPVFGVPTVPVAPREPEPGTAVSAFGHGLTAPVAPENPTASIGDALSRGDFRVIDDESCGAELTGLVDGPSVLCAAAPTAGICPGDSGGPLIQYVHGRPELAGLTSFAGEVVGKQCRRAIPAGFADAAGLRSFLTEPRPVLAPMPEGEVEVTGTKVDGATLTCALPPWAGAAPDSIAYRWYRGEPGPDGAPDGYYRIENETGPKLPVTAELARHKVMCIVTATSKGGAIELSSDPA
ncbi:S1 family peptidase [Amycolatopsis minnesotensis]|uniref:Trypsin n=1 Tax=Amycolatopsis minnesotensis TaxID=337894 RepID=A0ABN2SNW8_9PSEU